jgi:hypothetical protein
LMKSLAYLILWGLWATAVAGQVNVTTEAYDNNTYFSEFE